MNHLLVLERFYTPTGTFGLMRVNNTLVHTVERPWKNNAPFISCIPEGEYECEHRRFNKGKYEAIGIIMPEGSPRSHILFHRGNYPEDLAGCIAPNMELRFINGKGRGERSRHAFALLMGSFGYRDFRLKIQNICEGDYQWDFGKA